VLIETAGSALSLEGGELRRARRHAAADAEHSFAAASALRQPFIALAHSPLT